MWASFAAAVAVLAAILYLPGYALARAACPSRAYALAAAPIFSVAALCILGAFAGIAGLRLPGAALVGAFVAVAALAAGAFALLRRSRFHHGAPAPAAAPLRPRAVFRGDRVLAACAPFAYLAVGVFAGMLWFAGGFDSPDAYIQAFDNVHHLSHIRVMAESGSFSPFEDSYYVLPDEAAHDPYLSSGGGFYPPACSLLSALLVSALGVPVPLALNAMLFTFSFIVYPLCMWLLIDVAFCGRVRAVLVGAATVVVGGAFPWALLSWGPLYPNLVSYALLPAAAAFVVMASDQGVPRLSRLRLAAGALASVCALGLAQPNGVFSLAVLTAPWLAGCAGRLAAVRCRSRRGKAAAAAAGALAFAAAACLAWCALVSLPSLNAIVTYDWKATLNAAQAVAGAIWVSYDFVPPQFFLGALALIGIAVACCRMRRALWLAVAYAIVLAMLAVNTSTEGALKHVLTGLWYNDPFRIVSLLNIVAVPLATLGLYGIVLAVERAAACLVRRSFGAHGIGHGAPEGAASIRPSAWKGGEGRRAGNLPDRPRAHRRRPTPRARAAARARCVAGGMCALALVAGSCALLAKPTPGGLAEFNSGNRYAAVNPPWAVAERIRGQCNPDDPFRALTREETEFAHEALSLVPEGSAFLNCPHDGSTFLFGAYGYRSVYRAVSGYDGSDREASELVRHRLDEAATDAAVREAAASLGACYLLVLDQGERPDEMRAAVWPAWDRDEWSGILGVSDDTPGFSVMLAREDMRLYRIDAVQPAVCP